MFYELFENENGKGYACLSHITSGCSKLGFKLD